MSFTPSSVINSSQDDKFHLWSGGSLGDGGSFDLGWTDGDGSEAGLWDNFMHVFNDISGATAQQTLQSNQQEFDEYMYNQYNSPEALVRQFRDAGLNTNLLGSTSFGTAQSAAGAPGVNGTTPVQGIASAAQAFQAARSSSADVPLKAAETREKLTLPDLNKALTALYGNQSNLTEVEFDIAKKGMDWTLKNMEFTAKNAEQGYYNAIQMFNNLEQEWENLIKTGQVLDQEGEYKKWLAQTQQKIYNFWVDHNFPPDMNYLDYIWNNYLINKDYVGWQRFINGQFQLSSMEHQNAAKYGAYGSKIKLFGQELDLAYLVENGKDLGQAIVDKVSQTNPKLGEALRGLLHGESIDISGGSSTERTNSDGSSKPGRKSTLECKPSDCAALMWEFEEKKVRGDNRLPTKQEFRRMLYLNGYPSEWLSSHWDEIWNIFNK